VASAERPYQQAAAEARVGQVAKELDAAISDADGQRRRLLDAEAKLDAVENAAAREAAVSKLHEQMDETVEMPLRMLERPEEAGRRLLDGKPPKAKDTTGLPPDAAKMDRGVRKRLERLGRPASDYAIMLEAEVRGDPMPPKPRQEPAPASPGFFSGNLPVHAAVLKRMRELQAPESEYPRILEQVLHEAEER
jgi:hypothetical protein